MVDQVGSLVHEPFVVAVDRFDYRLDGLFAHLLRDLVHAFGEELGRVGAFRHLPVAALDHALQLFDEPFGLPAVEAGFAAGVADRSGGNCTDQQRVVVAVFGDAFYREEVAARFALCPKALAGTAVESHLAGGDGFLIGFGVHVAEHQHLQGVVVLDDCGNHALAVFRRV